MREYRGLTKDGKWVYGWPFQADNGRTSMITAIVSDGEGVHPFSFVEVLPETVGQETGLKDKNGREIYEGDIVKDRTPETNWWDGIVTWHKEGSVGWVVVPSLYKDRGRGEWGLNYNYTLEIIGNVHENPKLLENQ